MTGFHTGEFYDEKEHYNQSKPHVFRSAGIPV